MTKIRFFFCIFMTLSMTHVLAEQTSDPYAVTPENCGELTLDKCEEVMQQMKQYVENNNQKTQALKKDINRMHEEALELLSEEAEKAK